MTSQTPQIKTQPPMAIAVTNIEHVDTFAHGRLETTLWRADVKASRYQTMCRVFEGVYFLEGEGIASIAGLDRRDGLWPFFAEHEAALKQQAFIQFLRDATQEGNAALGELSQFFCGHEYSAEGKATAAYIAGRGISALMGIGFLTYLNEYALITDDPADYGWLEAAQSTLPFDALGQ